MQYRFQEITNFMVELSNKTSLPLEMWLIIYGIKYCLEHKIWEEKMRYLFSNENTSTGILSEKMILRSGRNIARLNNEGSDLYNLVSQCVKSVNYQYSSYYKVHGLFQVVQKYYIWMYKRGIWNCEYDCQKKSCAPWCRFSKTQELSQSLEPEQKWQKLFYVIDSKIDELVRGVMYDYYEYKSSESTKKILYKKDINYNFNDTWTTDEDQYMISKYEYIRETIKATYITISNFKLCVKYVKKLRYFKYNYFKNWKNSQLTQENLQFEMSLYEPKKWKEYYLTCRHLRSGKIVGPLLKPMRFCDAC